MRIIFVRHGQSVGNHYGLIQGHLDFNLSDEGRKQAALTAGEIKKIIGKVRPLIFSSDLSRAWETAVIIAEELELNLPIPDHRLRERNMGILQNTHWTTVNWEKVNKSEQKSEIWNQEKSFWKELQISCILLLPINRLSAERSSP